MAGLLEGFKTDASLYDGWKYGDNSDMDISTHVTLLWHGDLTRDILNLTRAP